MWNVPSLDLVSSQRKSSRLLALVLYTRLGAEALGAGLQPRFCLGVGLVCHIASEMAPALAGSINGGR